MNTSILSLFSGSRIPVSFEVFPPKKSSGIGSIYKSLDDLCALSPDFISVTYGAGGTGGQNLTTELARYIQRSHGIPAMAHQTCVGAKKVDMEAALDEMTRQRITNILALRGDMPADSADTTGDYRYAHELISEIKEHGGFTVGAACYPEGHIDCYDNKLNIEHLKIKEDCGADFFITQLFFNNNLFFDFLEQARAAGIKAPIIAGVMPIMSRTQIEKMIFMCGASLPSGIIKLLHRHRNSPGDMYKAGIEFAAKQLTELRDGGADGLHIYTMNRPDAARQLRNQK